jgi:predicted GIY-YIG superfamily endonuclease
MNPVEVCECVYVLKLEDSKWYVGKTYNLNLRIAQHKSNNGARWTKLHNVIDCVKVSFIINEKEMTLKYMRKYGWENVRGYSWCQCDLKKPPHDL